MTNVLPFIQDLKGLQFFVSMKLEAYIGTAQSSNTAVHKKLKASVNDGMLIAPAEQQWWLPSVFIKRLFKSDNHSDCHSCHVVSFVKMARETISLSE